MRISDWSSDVCSSDLLEDAVFLGGGAHAALRPVLADLDAMAALPELCDRRRAEPSLDDEAAGSRLARIEGTREVLVMEGGHIDRPLQIQAVDGMAQEEDRLPLVLLVAAGRAEGHVGPIGRAHV